MGWRPAAGLAALLLLSACVAPPAPEARVSEVSAEDCSGEGLVVLGVRDGMDGYGADIAEARLAACRAIGTPADPKAYGDAHAEGAARYCGVENAFRLGRKGIKPLRSCPAQAGFDNAYENGLALRDAIAPLPHVDVGTPGGPVRNRVRIGPWLLL